MSHNKNHDSQQLPVGRLGIISPYSCAELGAKVDNYLVTWRKKRHNEGVLYEGYDRDTYLIASDLPRFGSGEAKGVLKESVRGDDIYILVDVCNYSLTYSLAGQTNHMSPDDHYQNLKRIIAAIAGKARRINVIMPFLYESRQHRRTGRESLDCALALQELIEMGVENIITFDAHDPRIQNAIPLHGFETVQSSYQFIKNLLKKEKDLKLDKDHLMVISPDEGGMSRAIYLANNLGVDMGMFYKRRDYSTIVDGRNPIVAHEFLGADVRGKDMIIVDDMISSGESMIEVMKDWGYKVNETRFTIDDVFKAGEEGKLEEVFATGTAAVISPVGELYWKDKKLVINNGEIGDLSQKLYDELYGIQTGAIEDKYGWTVPV